MGLGWDGGAGQQPRAEDSKQLHVPREKGQKEQETLRFVARRPNQHGQQRQQADEAAHERLDDDGEGRQGSGPGLKGLGQGLGWKAITEVR